MAYLTLARLEAYDPEPIQRRSDITYVRFLCPFCGDEHRADNDHRCLSVDMVKFTYKCFRCGSGGVLADMHTKPPEVFMTPMRNRRREARARLHDKLRIATPDDSVD